MARTELAAAADLLEDAAADVSDGDDAERLRELADQLDRLSEADHGPDHGRLARIQAALNDVQDGAGDDVTATIDDADEAINAFRETLEGV